MSDWHSIEIWAGDYHWNVEPGDAGQLGDVLAGLTISTGWETGHPVQGAPGPWSAEFGLIVGHIRDVAGLTIGDRVCILVHWQGVAGTRRIGSTAPDGYDDLYWPLAYFQGRVADLAATPTKVRDPATGQLRACMTVKVTCTDYLVDLAQITVGEKAWPAELLADRVARIFREADLPVPGAYMYGTLAAREASPITALDALQETLAQEGDSTVGWYVASNPGVDFAAHPANRNLLWYPFLGASFAAMGFVGSDSKGTGWRQVNGAVRVRSELRTFPAPGPGSLDTSSMEVTWPAGGSPAVDLASPRLTPGATYTLSAYVFVPTGGRAVKLEVLDATAPATSATSTVTNAWQRLTVTFTAGPLTTAEGDGKHRLRVIPATAPLAGEKVWVDSAQLDAGAAATAWQYPQSQRTWPTEPSEDYPFHITTNYKRLPNGNATSPGSNLPLVLTAGPDGVTVQVDPVLDSNGRQSTVIPAGLADLATEWTKSRATRFDRATVTSPHVTPGSYFELPNSIPIDYRLDTELTDAQSMINKSFYLVPESSGDGWELSDVTIRGLPGDWFAPAMMMPPLFSLLNADLPFAASFALFEPRSPLVIDGLVEGQNPNGERYYAGIVGNATLTFAKGDWSMKLELRPDIARPYTYEEGFWDSISQDPAYLSPENLRADPTLGATRYVDLDPTLTPYDLRLARRPD